MQLPAAAILQYMEDTRRLLHVERVTEVSHESQLPLFLAMSDLVRLVDRRGCDKEDRAATMKLKFYAAHAAVLDPAMCRGLAKVILVTSAEMAGEHEGCPRCLYIIK